MKFYKEADDSWRVVAKDGSTVFFGQTADSKEAGLGGKTFNWYVTKAIDNNANYIIYDYTKDSGKAYLSRIEYTGNEAARVSGKYRVDFYLELRDDAQASYASGAKIKTAKRLKTIEALFNGGLAWRYELEYTNSPDTGRSLLKSFTQYTAAGEAYPAQAFTYQTKQ